MCLIIVKPEGCPFNDEAMENGWEMNPHGAGFMAWDQRSNTLVVKKGFFKLEDLKNALRPYTNTSVVVHMRWATHGEKNKENCHPFKITRNLAMVHNGIINIKITNDNFSDTWHFAQKLKPMIEKRPNIWLDGQFKAVIEKEITIANKLVFMDYIGRINIYNEKQGEWLDGCWYSNTFFTFGAWRGFDKAQKRQRILDAGYMIEPILVHGKALMKGNEWFCCENCYRLFRSHNSLTDFDGFDVCRKCKNGILSFLANPTSPEAPTMISLSDMDRFATALKRRDDALEVLKHANEIIKKVLESNAPEVVIDSEETIAERIERDECCGHEA